MSFQKQVSNDGTHSYNLRGKPLDVMVTLVDGNDIDISKLDIKYMHDLHVNKNISKALY